MPIRPDLRPLYPPHWRELSGRVRFDALVGDANVVAARTLSSCAVSRTDAGLMSGRRHGGTVGAGRLDGLTWWKRRPYG